MLIAYYQEQSWRNIQIFIKSYKVPNYVIICGDLQKKCLHCCCGNSRIEQWVRSSNKIIFRNPNIKLSFISVTIHKPINVYPDSEKSANSFNEFWIRLTIDLSLLGQRFGPPCRLHRQGRCHLDDFCQNVIPKNQRIYHRILNFNKLGDGYINFTMTCTFFEKSKFGYID